MEGKQKRGGKTEGSKTVGSRQAPTPNALPALSSNPDPVDFDDDKLSQMLFHTRMGLQVTI